MRVEALPPVPYPQVAATMSRAVFNPVVYRPLFERLGMVTCRTFETPAAGTIPLFLLDPSTCGRSTARRPPSWCSAASRAQERILDVL